MKMKADIPTRRMNTRRLYSKWTGGLFGVLFLLCAGHIERVSSRPPGTFVDQSASAITTQRDSSQAGLHEPSRTHRSPGSNAPHSVEVAAAPTLNQISYEPQVVHHLAVCVISALGPANLTPQRACDDRARSCYSPVIVSYSSGRSPPRRV